MDETPIKINNIVEKSLKNAMHYHGNAVRAYFLAIILVLIIATPFFKDRLLPIQTLTAVVAVVLFAIFAGLTSPKSKLSIVGDFIIAIFATIIFGQQAMYSYSGDYRDLFFIINLLLFILSAFSLYFGSKTLRGVMLYKGE